MSAARPDRPCVKCGQQTRAKDYICTRGCATPTAKRVETRCKLCGRRTMAKGGICPRCDYVPIDHGYGDEHALTDGEWVRRGLIQVWVEGDVCLVQPVRECGTIEAAKNKATRTADCANSRLWSGSSHPHSAKNGSD